MKKHILSFFVLLFCFILFNYKVFFAVYNNNLGNIYYNNGEYEKSLQKYLGASSYIENSSVYHNIGNSYLALYLNGEYPKTVLYDSLENYMSSLDLFESEVTSYNYIYVKTLIDELDKLSLEQNNIAEGQEKNEGINDGGLSSGGSTSNLDFSNKYKLYYEEEFGSIGDVEIKKIKKYLRDIDNLIINNKSYFDFGSIDLNRYQSDPFFDYIFGK